MIDKKIKIEKSIMFDESYGRLSKAVIKAHKKNPTDASAKLLRDLISIRGYVAEVESDLYVTHEIIKKYRNELRERNTKNQVL
jgi:hypothetical protein